MRAVQEHKFLCSMLSIKKRFFRACLSCLQHDLKVAAMCVKFHLLDENNPFSSVVKSDLSTISDSLDLLYKMVDDPAFQQSVVKRF